MKKPWWQSKVVLLGAIETLLGVGELIRSAIVDGTLGDVVGWIALATGILTIISRIWFTSKTLT